MGTASDDFDQKKKRKRGSVDNASRLSGLGNQAKKKGDAEWASARADEVLAVIDIGTRLGMVVSFSLSRDQGAYGLQLYEGGEKAQMWFNQDADLSLELEKVYAYLESLG